jgi:DNA polymerase (family 10)
LTNGQIIDLLETTASLLELHDENEFKIKALKNAIFNLDKISSPLWDMSLEELEKLDGVGKGIAAKIDEINNTGTSQEYLFYLSSTPPGVMDLMGIKGVGPKKVRTLWKGHEIDSLEKLHQACIDRKLEEIKGFGEKTQESILKSVLFILDSRGKFLYADVENFANQLETKLKELDLSSQLSLSGDIRRKMETVAQVQVIIGTNEPDKVIDALDHFVWLEKNEITSGPFVWRGNDRVLNASVEIKLYPENKFGSELYLHSSGKRHLLSEAKEGVRVINYLKSNSFKEEQEVFTLLEMDFIVPEYREGFKEIIQAKNKTLPQLLESSDLKGILHNHSTYSDGKNTLEEMANYCKELGYQYLGITDHSKTATYANGLQEFRVKKQHEEIDLLNQKLAPFKIFKGIESDILADGSLDYSDDVLCSFDFIVSSIHSGFNMDEEKATERIIKAIENPYTTILGHLTGKLLLKREGYPINHRKIIDACADNKVIIEINANPRRLDIDWRWIDYALEKDVVIAINPDAHVKEGYHDMQFGVNVGRKGGLTAAMTFNAWPLEKVEAWFKEKKK